MSGLLRAQARNSIGHHAPISTRRVLAPSSRGGRACLLAFHGEIDYFDYPLGDKLSLEVSR